MSKGLSCIFFFLLFLLSSVKNFNALNIRWQSIFPRRQYLSTHLTVKCYHWMSQKHHLYVFLGLTIFKLFILSYHHLFCSNRKSCLIFTWFLCTNREKNLCLNCTFIEQLPKNSIPKHIVEFHLPRQNCIS